MRVITPPPGEPNIYVADSQTEILQVILCKGLFKSPFTNKIYHDLFLKTNEGIFSRTPYTDFKQAWIVAKSLAQNGFDTKSNDYWGSSCRNFFLNTEYNLNFHMFDYPKHKGYTPVNLIFDRVI